MENQKKFYGSGATHGLAFREAMLKNLRNAILANETYIIEALKADLGKSAHEAVTTEIGQVLGEISSLRKQLPRLMKWTKVKTNLINFGSKSYLVHEPYGNVLVLSPWNYPFSLAMAPLAGAIAGGNTVVLKPSEHAPRTAEVIEKIITKTFPPEFIAVVQGGVPETTRLLEQRFDLIFFTGSPNVGKVVMAAAAKHLTPVVLELGGKSPCIVDKSANLELAARRILFGKATNAGQTCVAPDYLLVDKAVRDDFVKQFKVEVEKMFGADMKNHPDYGRIINDSHFNRIVRYLTDGRIIHGGHHSEPDRHIDVTLMEIDDLDVPVMREEIFGPLLPMVVYEHIDEVFAIMDRNPEPLALYLFAEDESIQQEVVRKVRFGGGSINDTLMHLTNEHLPFGGRGTSGIGRYHGKHSFETFTHAKAVLKGSTRFDLAMKYPPYDGKRLPLLKRFLYR